MIQYGKGSPKHGLLPKTEATVEAVDSRRNLIIVRTGQDDLVTYSPSRLKTATNDSKVYRPELQPISQGERIRITRNDKERNVRAGDFATVTRIDHKGGLKVRLDSGKEMELTAKQARHVEHGYAVESGRRVRPSGSSSLAMQRRPRPSEVFPSTCGTFPSTSRLRRFSSRKPPSGRRPRSTNRRRSHRSERFSAATVSA